MKSKWPREAADRRAGQGSGARGKQARTVADHGAEHRTDHLDEAEILDMMDMSSASRRSMDRPSILSWMTCRKSRVFSSSELAVSSRPGTMLIQFRVQKARDLVHHGAVEEHGDHGVSGRPDAWTGSSESSSLILSFSRAANSGRCMTFWMPPTKQVTLDDSGQVHGQGFLAFGEDALNGQAAQLHGPSGMKKQISLWR